MTTGGLDDPKGNGPHVLFADYHDELESACRSIEVAIECDDAADLVTRYRCFEKAILEHLATEEDELLSAYADFDAADALSIREEHAALRRHLFSIGVDVELHTVNAAAMRQLLETLRAHALHEDRGMYPWAQVHLPLAVHKRLVLRITRSLDALGRLRRAFAERHVVPVSDAPLEGVHE